MVTVILAEKPPQAKNYADVFGYEKKDGYFALKPTPIFNNDETYITYCVGHLVSLAPPEYYNEKYKKWNLGNLPIYPDKFEFIVSKDKKKQFGIVAKLLKKADTIIIATDCDREGENIGWSVIHHANCYSNKKTYKRLWINSLEKESILDGFKHLKNAKDYYPFYLEAKTRQLSDWLYGMNASPLYTLLLQEKGINEVFSVGRVQTPTVVMIYNREREINNFKKENYFEIEGQIENEGSVLKANLKPVERFETEDDLLLHLKDKDVKIGGNLGSVSNKEVKEKKEFSPRLFSLSLLQSEMNKLFKVSASETLSLCQTLYEKKLLTYPRTDCSYITENEFKYVRDTLDSYFSYLNIEKPKDLMTEPKNHFVDEKKVQEHHAIIPTRSVPGTNLLSGMELNLYLLVLKRTVAMFFSEFIFDETTIIIDVNTLQFALKGKIIKESGWKLFLNSKETQNDSLLPNYTINDNVKLTIASLKKETQPKKLFTEGTLILEMKNIGKTIEDSQLKETLKNVEGIGTEATRASIIETIKKRNYISVDNNQLTVTEKGKILCLAVQEQQLISSAEMTAQWEQYLNKIGKEEGSEEVFIKNIKQFIDHLIKTAPSNVQQLDLSTYETQKELEITKNSLGDCPCCDGKLILKKEFYGCTNYPTCKFTLATKFRNKKLTKSNLNALIKGENTIVKRIQSKNKKFYSAIVTRDNQGSIQFVDFVK